MGSHIFIKERTSQVHITVFEQAIQHVKLNNIYFMQIILKYFGRKKFTTLMKKVLAKYKIQEKIVF